MNIKAPSEAEQVVVVIGGGPLTERALSAIIADSYIVAADSGLDHAVAAGLEPDLLVGDFDSISAAGRMWAYQHTTETEEHATDKDATDAELALARAAAIPAAKHLLMLGGCDPTGEQRLDHQLGTLLALGNPILADFESVVAVIGSTEIRVLHPGHETTLTPTPSGLFSLIAMHGECAGVNVAGARWPLNDAALSSFESRGLSNEFGADPKAPTTVSVAAGVLMVVLP